MKQILGLTQTPSYSELDQEAISPQHVYKRHKRTNLSSLLSYSIGRTISIVPMSITEVKTQNKLA